MIMIDRAEKGTDGEDKYARGVLDGLAMAIQTVKKLPRANRSSLNRLVKAIENNVPVDNRGGFNYAGLSKEDNQRDGRVASMAFAAGYDEAILKIEAFISLAKRQDDKK